MKGKRTEWTIIQIAECLTGKGKGALRIDKFNDLKSDFYKRLEHIDQQLVRRI